jgi:hypothetical protein
MACGEAAFFFVFAPVTGAGAGIAIRACTAIAQTCCGFGRRALHHKCTAFPAGTAAVSTTTVRRAWPGSFSLMR